MRRQSVALVVIARDEARSIERLLRSVAPWVDRMVVVDTGSKDGTAGLAMAQGAEVFTLPWPNDFAAARNVSLTHASADWHVVLDADEWLIDGGEVLSALRQMPPRFVGALQREDYFDDGGLRTARGWLSRILPGSLRYQGRIHEQVEHQMPVRRLSVRVGHDGYLPKPLLAKRGRNRCLLEVEVTLRPDDAYAWYQLGKDCAVYGEHEHAETAFERAVTVGIHGMPWAHDLVVRRLFALKCLKRHEQAMDVADAQMSVCSEVPDFFFAIGDLLLDLAADDPQRADELIPMIEAAWRRCLALGERPELSDTVHGRGSYLAAHNLGLVLDMTNREAEAQALRLSHPMPGRV